MRLLREKLNGLEFWKNFGRDFNENVKSVKEKRTREVLDLLNESLGELIFDTTSDGKIDRKCQLCDTGELSLKNSFRGGAFIGCSNYPECKFTRPLSKAKAAEQNALPEAKLIGINDDGKEIILKSGRFGPYLQYEITNDTIKIKKSKKKVDEKNVRNVSIPKGIDISSIDLIRAKFLCALPKILGQHPDSGKRHNFKFWQIWSLFKMRK